MKKTSPTQSGFSKQRLVLGLAFCSISGILAFLAFAGVPSALVKSADSSTDDIPRYMPVPGEKADDLARIEMAWHDRLTYPTGRFDPAWVRQAAAQDALISRELPLGIKVENLVDSNGAPLVLNPNAFTALGPAPERMTGCSGCFDYGVTQGRVNTIVVDPTTTTNGSIVAYIGTVGGGVWKTTNCCSGSTNWTLLTNDPLISTTAIDTLTIDPNNHNVVYAGTGDLNFGSFSMGSQGILKTTDGGTTWTVLGASVFGPAYTEPAGQFPQYNAVGKVRVDPNNSSRVVAGTKKGLYFSYDRGVNWSGPCLTNAMTSQRQDITGLELSNMGGGVTRILAAVGTRGFATTVQYDLGLQGANGVYKGTMPASGCPIRFHSHHTQRQRLRLWRPSRRQSLRIGSAYECGQRSSLFQHERGNPAQPRGYRRSAEQSKLHLRPGRLHRREQRWRLRRRLWLPARGMVEHRRRRPLEFHARLSRRLTAILRQRWHQRHGIERHSRERRLPAELVRPGPGG